MPVVGQMAVYGATGKLVARPNYTTNSNWYNYSKDGQANRTVATNLGMLTPGSIKITYNEFVLNGLNAPRIYWKPPDSVYDGVYYKNTDLTTSGTSLFTAGIGAIAIRGTTGVNTPFLYVGGSPSTTYFRFTGSRDTSVPI